MNTIAPPLAPITPAMSRPVIAPQTDPIIGACVRDAYVALLRASTTVRQEHDRAAGRLSVDARALARVRELRTIAATFARLLTDLPDPADQATTGATRRCSACGS